MPKRVIRAGYREEEFKNIPKRVIRAGYREEEFKKYIHGQVGLGIRKKKSINLSKILGIKKQEVKVYQEIIDIWV